MKVSRKKIYLMFTGLFFIGKNCSITITLRQVKAYRFVPSKIIDFSLPRSVPFLFLAVSAFSLTTSCKYSPFAFVTMNY